MMKRFGFSSLRVRLLLLVLFAALPALGLTLYTASEERRLAAAKAQEDALRVARLAAFSQVRLIDETRQLLVAMSQLPHVRNGNPDRCNSFFALLLKEYPLYANLGVIHQDGNLFCSAVPTRGPVIFSDSDLLQKSVETRDFTIGEFRIDRTTGRATINFGYPVIGRTGQVRAIVFSAMDLLWLTRLAAEAQLPQGSSLTVLDQGGTILARYPDVKGLIGRPVPEDAVIKAIRAQRDEDTTEAVGLDGIVHLFAFVKLEGVPQLEGVNVAVGIPSAIAFAQANRVLSRNLRWLGLVALLAFAAAWIGSDRFILRQVRILVESSRRLGTGDLGARTGLSYNGGELGLLAQAFDEMAESLQAFQNRAVRSEAALTESEERYRTVAETASDAIITIDEGSRIHFVNRAAVRVFGYTKEKMLGQDFTMLLPEHQRDLHRALLRRYLENGQWNMHWELVDISGLHQSGKEIPIEISFGEFFKGGQRFFTGIVYRAGCHRAQTGGGSDQGFSEGKRGAAPGGPPPRQEQFTIDFQPDEPSVRAHQR